jgi:hypothetical protein
MAMLSKTYADAAWSEPWKSKSRIGTVLSDHWPVTVEIHQ